MNSPLKDLALVRVATQLYEAEVKLANIRIIIGDALHDNEWLQPLYDKIVIQIDKPYDCKDIPD